MPEPYDTYVYNLWVSYTWTGWELDDAQVDINSAWFWLNRDEWKDTAKKTLAAIQHIHEAVEKMIGEGLAPCNVNYLDDALLWIGANWPSDAEPYVLTWEAICEAWVADDFAGKEWTVAIIDHMRRLMWDKPFDIKFAASPTEQRE